MQFNVRPSERARQLLLLHSVPRSLISDFTFDLRSLENLEIPGEPPRLIRATQQATWFQQLWETLPITPGVYVAASWQYHLVARRCGLLIFWRYLEQSLNFPKLMRRSLPLWYQPSLSFADRILHQYNAGQHNESNLLLLDNLYDDMPGVKRDKVHDLLQLMCDRPRLLLLRSRDPYNYCLEKLGVRPNRIFYFDKQPKREII